MDIQVQTSRSVLATHDDFDDEDDGAVDRTRMILNEFKNFTLDEYPKASALCSCSVHLFEEARDHLTQDQNLVYSGEWSAVQFDRDMELVMEHQRNRWGELLLAAQNEIIKVQKAYVRVKEAEKNVIRHFADYQTTWMGLPTGNHLDPNKIYANPLLELFLEAKQDMESLIGYPDGVLTKVSLIRQRIAKEIPETSRRMHRVRP